MLAVQLKVLVEPENWVGSYIM